MRPSSVWLERIPDKDEVQSSILWAATNIDAYSNTFFIRTENPEVVSSSLTGTHSGFLSSDGRASMKRHLVIRGMGLQGWSFDLQSKKQMDSISIFSIPKTFTAIFNYEQKRFYKKFLRRFNFLQRLVSNE